MNPPAEACTGYWYNVNVKTPTAGPAWKCISQQEYNTIMAQNAKDDQITGGVILTFLGCLAVIAIIVFSIYWLIGKYVNRGNK